MVETLKAGAMQVKAKDANRKAIAELIQKANRKEISFSDFVTQTRELGGEVIFGELQVESEDKDRITELLEQFNTGKLNIDTFISKVREQGDKAEFWNYETSSNPQYEGNNETRLGFKYNPYHHVKGKLMQGVMKTAVKSAINFAHANIIKHYDREAFVYEDARLKAIDEYCKRYIDDNFQESYPYKSDFMCKIVDIFLFLMKEDIYYTARWLEMINGVPRGHELTENEKANILKWH